MNETSIINNFVIDKFNSNELVNTISIVSTNTIDYNKENIYPLVNIDLTTVEHRTDVLVYSFIVTIVQQRDITPKKIDSKLMADTNYIDNLNETVSIGQRFVNELEFQNNDDNIEIDSVTDFDVLKDWRGNGLDGVQLTIDLSIPNKGKSC